MRKKETYKDINTGKINVDSTVRKNERTNGNVREKNVIQDSDTLARYNDEMSKKVVGRLFKGFSQVNEEKTEEVDDNLLVGYDEFEDDVYPDVFEDLSVRNDNDTYDNIVRKPRERVVPTAIPPVKSVATKNVKKDDKAIIENFHTSSIDYDQIQMLQEKTGRLVKIDYDDLPYSELNKNKVKRNSERLEHRKPKRETDGVRREPTEALRKEPKGSGREGSVRRETEYGKPIHRNSEKHSNVRNTSSNPNRPQTEARHQNENDSTLYPPRRTKNSRSKKELQTVAIVRISAIAVAVVLMISFCGLILDRNRLAGQVKTLTAQVKKDQDKINLVASEQATIDTLNAKIATLTGTDAAANQGVVADNGTTTNPDSAGTTPVAPTVTTPAGNNAVTPNVSPNAVTSGLPTKYTVVAKDNLGKISQKFYKDANQTQKIKDANGLKNDNISIGQVLTIPK